MAHRRIRNNSVVKENLTTDGAAALQFMAEPFSEQQKRALLGVNGAGKVLRSILYGGSLTSNGNTVNFDGRNSHALKLHLEAPGISPKKGFVTVEEVEKYLPLALAQKPVADTKLNKRNRKKTNKKYRITDNKVRYTLVTSWNGDFRSFYSNKKTPGEVNSQKAGSASSPEQTDTISQTFEKANNYRFLLAEFSEAERREKAHLEYNRKRDQYLYDNFPFYREAVEFAGFHDFKIKPSGKFRGEEFSGSFIAPEFVKYSGEKAAKNSGKLDAAQGVNSNELAARLARSWGRDHLASSFNPAIPTIMAKIQSIRRIEAVSLKNIIPQITAPTVPIPVQIAYAVPSGSVLVANARPMMLPVIAAITMIDGTSLVKPWLYFIATAQQTSNIPAKNKYNHAIKYLHNQNHRLSRWYAPRLQGDGTGSPTRALNYLPLATTVLQLQMQ